MNTNAQGLYEDLVANRLPKFNMLDWCGTACCIGGNAQIRMQLEKDTDDDFTEAEIAQWLGLPARIGMRLFYPGDHELENHPWHGICADPYKATQPQAAEALKRACELSEAQ